MRRLLAATAIALVPLIALAQGVDNPNTNPQDVTCNEFGVCNSTPGGSGGGGGTFYATDDAGTNYGTDDADTFYATN